MVAAKIAINEKRRTLEESSWRNSAVRLAVRVSGCEVSIVNPPEQAIFGIRVEGTYLVFRRRRRYRNPWNPRFHSNSVLKLGRVTAPPPPKDGRDAQWTTFCPSHAGEQLAARKQVRQTPVYNILKMQGSIGRVESNKAGMQMLCVRVG
jgi:hypothetical protein